MVLRRDAGVFMHLHPMGTASMSAQAQLMRRERGDTALLDAAQISAAMATATATATATAEAGTPEMVEGGVQASHAMHAAAPGTLSFPFAFPSAGAYRVFVQVRRNGVIETAAFDVTLREPAR